MSFGLPQKLGIKNLGCFYDRVIQNEGILLSKRYGTKLDQKSSCVNISNRVRRSLADKSIDPLKMGRISICYESNHDGFSE